ncbi:bifunctional DNA-binding transcriptional regulator/O6-methylguanine-DNA methyltransferase Ada [Leptolyngbya sp. 7M]|uniref:bifunctional DNA-binding transcriptional regulator/O6-methylguanine-DNA methyltransferase Ada n=1 Tax=Leptolyngbya sp. 7M TaxID=2812896 RepID=UPI001B8A8E02|nr:bifunctional DNA-binding transcriptional regulator/O6-methylguanine-DNA methyltransferase Ada [Leptolyngbya sp. 7M]QYO67877.1 bifunctional DNA-binding transcriptional regulator/O6-methylguanine-DNA methyltransferase Ada [Leptolyngbya sp. 7M]
MQMELYWQAVKRNDARFDGIFYLGVKTTGIYCKPSCRARTPKRENVEFFPTPESAEQVGLRACLRCRPRDINIVDPHIVKLIRASELLDGWEAPNLKLLAAELDVSPFHLQKSFKEIFGVSPKKYYELKRMERFKRELKSGSDVTTAMYEAGFGSSSRLYGKAAENLGMTPAEYKKGGKGVKINYTIPDCELGRILVARTIKGLCNVAFADDDEELINNLNQEFPNAEIVKDAKVLKAFVDEILKHLSGKENRLDLPLDIQATAFQMRVWDILRKIPYGETVTYSQLAEELGDKKKVRAVAQACARNRIAVVIPCHRVVGKDGSLSGYRWGVERKRKLLEAEKNL